MMRDFDREMAALQVRWRELHVDTPEQGFQNGLTRPWILPSKRWEDGLWPGIRSGTASSVADYLAAHDVSPV